MVYQWARGTAFTDICQLTDVMEVRRQGHCCVGSTTLPDADAHADTGCPLLQPAQTWAFFPQGSIVRTVVRLDETCREFRDAARVMGDTALWQQMTAASAAIKRDVVFAASLYVA